MSPLPSEAAGRKTRSDKGVARGPRRSAVQEWRDMFADMPAGIQEQELEILQEINRQAQRGKLPRPEPQQEVITCQD